MGSGEQVVVTLLADFAWRDCVTAPVGSLVKPEYQCRECKCSHHDTYSVQLFLQPEGAYMGTP